MATLYATDTRVILREMNQTAEALAAVTALVIAGADKQAVLSELARASAAAAYGRDWFLRCDFIVPAQAEPVALPMAAE